MSLVGGNQTYPIVRKLQEEFLNLPCFVYDDIIEEIFVIDKVADD